MNEAPVYPPEEATGAPRSGLLRLRDSVAAYFLEWAVGAVVAPVGLKYRSFTLNASPGGANRVVLIPGEFDGSNAPKARKYGALSRETENHASVNNPKEIASWERPFTISIWSAPVPGLSKEEGDTIGAAEDLLEQVVRAILESGMADITLSSILINSQLQENGFGVELLLSGSQRSPLFGVTLDYVKAKPAIDATGMIP